MAITIGEASSGDIVAMVALLGELFAQEADFVPDAAKQQRGLAIIVEQPDRGRLFVVREGDKVVGMASILFLVSTFEGGVVGVLEDVVITERYRGLGLGRQMLDYVIAWSKAQGLARLTLLTDADNHRGQALYLRAGFIQSSMQVMRLPLGAVA